MKILFQLNYLFKDLFSKYSHILKYWSLRLQQVNLGIRRLMHSAHKNIPRQKWISEIQGTFSCKGV